MNKLLTPFLLYTALPKGSIVCPNVEVLDDPMEAAQVMQDDLNLRWARETTRASGEGSSSQSP